MHSWNQRLSSRIIVVVALVLSALVPTLLPKVAYAAFQQSYLRLDRMKANTATGGLVCAQPATAGTEAKLVIVFPSTYTVNATAANWTVSTAALPTGATAWPGIGTASSANNATQTVTFPSSDLTVGTLYCFTFASVNTLTTAASAANSQQASIATQTSGSSVVDLTQIALSNVTDDQIQVTAVVPPSFIFTLDGNSDAFASNLDPLNVISTGGRSVTVTTNAKGGWIAWAKDQYQGLHSSTTGYTIPTAGTINAAPSGLTAGTEGYVLDTNLTTDASGGCTLAIDPEYNGSTSSSGGTFTSGFQPIAACTGVSPATANGDVISLVERAAISGATPAGSDYTDVVTVVGAGNF